MTAFLKSRVTTPLAVLLAATLARGQTYFVDASGGDDGNLGTSWTDAFETLDKALDTAGSGDTILVAEGGYGPYHAGDGYIELEDELDIHGGFLGGAGGSTSPDGPDGSFLQTQINGFPSATETGPLVRSISNTLATLDGFVIQDGDVDTGDTGSGNGAAFYCTSPDTVVLENITFRDNAAENHGGAVYLSGGGAYDWDEETCELDIFGLELDRCIFYSNTAESGGAVALGDLSQGGGYAACGVEICNGIFFENEATGELSNNDGGGAIYLAKETFMEASNCLIHDNLAEAGGGIFSGPDEADENTVGIIILRHCTIALNDSDADNGAGIHMLASGSDPNCARLEVLNSIVWGNATNASGNYDMFYAGGGIPFTVEASDYGLVSGVDVSAGTNISANPRFINAAAGNFLLDDSPLSPCIDAAEGDYVGLDFADIDEDTLTGEVLPLDLRLTDRDHDFPGVSVLDTVDMGAFEARE